MEGVAVTDVICSGCHTSGPCRVAWVTAQVAQCSLLDTISPRSHANNVCQYKHVQSDCFLYNISTEQSYNKVYDRSSLFIARGYFGTIHVSTLPAPS